MDYFSAKITRNEKFFAVFLQEKNFLQIFAVPKGKEKGHKAREGRISSAVEHFTRNEGVPSSNLGFGSNNQEITVFVISFFVPFGEGKEG